MITAQRQRRRRRASTIAAGLAAVAGIVLGLASPALAASVAEVGDFVEGNSASVHGTWPDNGDPGDEPQTRRLTAGLIELLIDGEVESEGYCIDINTPLVEGADLDEIEWDTSGVANLDKVEAILRWYHPNGSGPESDPITGTDAQKAAATQAAIWHYTDGFQLTDSAANDPVVIENYAEILRAVNAGLDGFGEPTVSLTITPPAVTEVAAGELVGPYVINTTADSVTLSPSAGVTLHDAEGEPFTGEVVDGTEVWLSSDNAGAGTITATAQTEVSAGRVFFTEGVQRLVLASTVTSDTTAEAPVSFTTPTSPTTSSTTSTTVPETTTTTVPITVQTTVPETTTTTVPIVPNQDTGTGGGLPVTGAQTMVLVAVAVVLLGIGTGFAIVSRRKRLEG